MISNKGHNIRICERCVMDSTVPNIVFNEDNTCNYCNGFIEKRDKHILLDQEARERRLNSLIKLLKKSNSNKNYDCIVGVSGGVDSTWSLVKSIELGLKPLAVHMDSGWNSELAQNNISKVVKTLGVDLYTHVIDWPEIRGLMDAFFAADVIDVEVLYDNAMLAVNYQLASRFNIKYILAGTNIATEGVDIPSSWNWYKSDKKNIKSISKVFNGPSLKTFPSISTIETAYYSVFKGIKWISFLDYLDYNKERSLSELEDKFGFKRYPYKHYESVFTRFFQGYILPTKFGVDKRKPHLSSLIMNNELNRNDALNLLEDIPYPSARDLEIDKKYFIKKMKWSDKKFLNYINRPEVPHDSYKSEVKLYQNFLKLYRKLGLSFGKINWK